MAAAETLNELTRTFLSLHTRKEDLFWSVKMGIADEPERAVKDAADAEVQMQRFLQDPTRLAALRKLDAGLQDSSVHRSTVRGWIAMFAAHTIESAEGRALSEEIVAMESELERRRGAMELGYVDPETSTFERASSVKLSLMVRSDPDERRRKAAFEGLRSIERMVLDAGFLDIVRKRNRLGRMLGYEDYYDWRVSVVERMSKRQLFRVLDDLQTRTAAHVKEQLAAFRHRTGEAAQKPWNFAYLRGGKIEHELDPYFSFRTSLRRWGRAFEALGVRFRGATLTLDLLDRPGKYENGFMHGPEPAFSDKGRWRPARINFTANAVLSQVGSGLRAIETLFHEGGHAAHFSNVRASAPCFSQEFAPTSVAYAETQSMFMDSLIGDADFRLRYATDAAGNAMPVELINAAVAERQPFRAWDVRAMLTIPMAERALYELTDDELEPDRVLQMFRSIESDMQGLEGGVRPVLSVPHLLSGESSAYYHGYVLAEMAVEQTRRFLLARDGFLTDNPRVGHDLAVHYWAPGNAATFNETLEGLTGTPLSADALIADCLTDVDTAQARTQQAVDRLSSGRSSVRPVDLDATIRVVHGREVVATTEDTNFEHACEAFEAWIDSLSG